jgi:hypothetical protein
LTGLLLPEFKLVSIPSRRDHWREIRQRHAQAKSPRQFIPPRQTMSDGWDQASELILKSIIVLAQTASRRILAELKESPGFSELSPRQQAKAYAAAAGSEMPWSALLNMARNKEVHLDIARRLFKSHAEARDLLSWLNGVDEK